MEEKISVGIGINLFNAGAVLMREDKSIAAQIERKNGPANANETISMLFELFDEILNKAKKLRETVECVGLALGGIVNRNKGIVYWPQREESSYVYVAVPLKEFFEKKFGLPVSVDNDATACALAEHKINFSRYKNIIYMFSGVGCGIIIDGSVYRGKSGRAGEIFLRSKKAMSSTLGDFSFLRQWPADLDMVKRAKELISLGKVTSLIRKITPTGELALKDIFNEAKKKDPVSRTVLGEAAISLGVKIAFLINLFDPNMVIIGGGLEESGDFLLQECIDSVKDFAFNESRKNCKIAFSQLGSGATSLGAALGAFNEINQ
ncbi:MAG: ROK family protein [Candidatus Omnitrophota bacterium]